MSRPHHQIRQPESDLRHCGNQYQHDNRRDQQGQNGYRQLFEAHAGYGGHQIEPDPERRSGNPNSSDRVMTMPNCTRSMPNMSAIGSNSGNRMILAGGCLHEASDQHQQGNGKGQKDPLARNGRKDTRSKGLRYLLKGKTASP